MSFQWTFLAAFLYSELIVVVILLLPFISPLSWQKLFKSRLSKAFSAGATYYFNFIIIVFTLLFLDSIREVRKYSNLQYDLSAPNAETHAHMKQFRAQRNFYIAGFALFLWFVIKRLIHLLSSCAREMADSEAARKQAAGVHRHLKDMMANDSQKNEKNEGELSSEKETEYEERISNYKKEIRKTREEIDELRERYTNTVQEYDKLSEEHRKLQIQFAIAGGSESSKDK